MPDKNLPAFPYGAVYFRKSNPPPEDWAADYRTAAEDGMNIFRHWFMWSAIETAPGEYDWADYDRQLELAAEHGMKTIIAEMISAPPEWAYRVHADARLERRDGSRVGPSYSVSCVTGGFPGLCLDEPEFREKAGGFLRALAGRYCGHAGLGGYDLWNECNFMHDVCYCPATQEKFRSWLNNKYGSLKAVAQAWRRYGMAEWADVTAPRYGGPYPDVLDWLQFRIDNAYADLRWRVEIIRAADPDSAITAHGIAASLHNLAPGGSHDWRAAAEVESYGATWGSSRHGDEPWKQLHAFDLVRAASRGKPFWHAEHYGGPLWMQPQVLGKPRDEGRIASPEDIRYWTLASLMAGASGFMYLRWRPLLDGPLFGAFGPYGMDGSRTPRSEMVKEIGQWIMAPEQEALRRARPVQGEVGILFAPETQLFTYAQQGSTAFYASSMQGAYRGFFDNNIQADWVHLDDIDAYRLLYLPFPVMLKRATVERLREWVADGGTLVSEGCPAYFGEAGRVGMRQPNYGLDEVFGARESWVEFTPDLLGDLRLQVGGLPVWGGIFMQAYQPTTGTPVGWYADGQVAAVDNAYVAGHTRLVGSMLGAGHAAHADGPAAGLSAPFFAGLLDWAHRPQHARTSDPRLIARLHQSPEAVFLWIANPTRQPLPALVELGPAWRLFKEARPLRGPEAVLKEGRRIEMTVPARDVAVLALG